MDAIMIVVMGAVFVEAFVTAVKPIWNVEKRTLSWGALASLLVGLGIAFATGLNLPDAVGVPIGVPVVPQLITGIVISRGSNYVYDIISQIKNSVSKQTSQGE